MNQSREITLMTSDRVLEKTVLVGPSVNIETRATISPEDMALLIAQGDCGIVRGQKTSVRELVIYDAAKGGKATDVTLMGGHRFSIRELREPITEVTAGSAANIANALAEFGCGDTGIIGAVGRGGGREMLVRSLNQRGVTDLLFFRRPGGTARSLILYEPDGTATILAKKPPYDISAEMLRALSERTAPSVLVCTGFLDYELPLVKALLNSARVGEGRILSPHVGCFEREQARRQCLELAAQADLFHVNEYEAGRLLAYEDGWEASSSDTEIQEAGRRIGSKIVCITRGAQGCVTYERATGRVHRQSGFAARTVHNIIGAGDVHLAALIWYLWLRRRKLSLPSALEVAARICAHKIEFAANGLTRPWEGIPDSATRKPWVREAEARHAT